MGFTKTVTSSEHPEPMICEQVEVHGLWGMLEDVPAEGCAHVNLSHVTHYGHDTSWLLCYDCDAIGEIGDGHAEPPCRNERCWCKARDPWTALGVVDGSIKLKKGDPNSWA